MQKITKDQQDRLDFMYEVMQKKSDNLNDTFNSHTNKINYLFGFTAVSIGLYLPLLLEKGFTRHVPPVLTISLLLGMFGLLVTLFCLCLASRPRRFWYAPHADTIYSKTAFQKEYYYLKKQVIADMKESFHRNIKRLNSIYIWLNRSIWLLFISIFIIIASSLLLEFYEVSLWRQTTQKNLKSPIHHHLDLEKR